MILLQFINHFSDVLDWTARIVAAFGTTGMGAYFLNKKFRTKSEKVIEGKTAEEVVATSRDRIETSSVTAVEARVAVMIRTWDNERNSLERTIDFQARQLNEARSYGESRDEIIADLKDQVESLQTQLEDFQRQVSDLGNKLKSLTIEGEMTHKEL